MQIVPFSSRFSIPVNKRYQPFIAEVICLHTETVICLLPYPPLPQ